MGFTSHRLSFDKVKPIDEDDQGNIIPRENVQNYLRLQEIAELERNEMEQSMACEKAFKYVVHSLLVCFIYFLKSFLKIMYNLFYHLTYHFDSYNIITLSPLFTESCAV